MVWLQKMKEKQDREESNLGSGRGLGSSGGRREGRATVNAGAEEQLKKRVTFEKVLAGKLTSICHQMEEQLSRASIHTDLQVSQESCLWNMEQWVSLWQNVFFLFF